MLRQGIGRRVRTRAALVLLAMLACATSAQAQLGVRTLKIGARGRDVKLAQKDLTLAGFKTRADGVYGSTTAGAVKRFERSEGRHVDGALNPADQRALVQAASGAGAAPSSGQA